MPANALSLNPTTNRTFMPTTLSNSPLDLCLQTSFAHAQIQLALDEELAWAHGLSYQDLVLLTRIARGPLGRLSVDELARSLGLSMTALLRLLLPLEKTGHVQRDSAPLLGEKRYVSLRPAGITQLRNATVTAEATCATLMATVFSQACPFMASEANSDILAQAQ